MTAIRRASLEQIPPSGELTNKSVAGCRLQADVAEPLTPMDGMKKEAGDGAHMEERSAAPLPHLPHSMGARAQKFCQNRTRAGTGSSEPTARVRSGCWIFRGFLM